MANGKGRQKNKEKAKMKVKQWIRDKEKESKGAAKKVIKGLLGSSRSETMGMKKAIGSQKES